MFDAGWFLLAYVLHSFFYFPDILLPFMLLSAFYFSGSTLPFTLLSAFYVASNHTVYLWSDVGGKMAISHFAFSLTL